MTGIVDPYNPQAVDPNQTFVRILVCHVCRSIEEIPDYDGPHEYDQLLNYKTAPHQFDSGTPHKGLLLRIPEKDWNKHEYKMSVIERIEELVRAGQGEGLGAPVYDLKSTFKEDAFHCWSKEHLRPTDIGKCDYHKENKALYADTKAERKAEGMDISLAARPKHYLCDYCPLQSIVDQKKRAAAKMYDKQKWE